MLQGLDLFSSAVRSVVFKESYVSQRRSLRTHQRKDCKGHEFANHTHTHPCTTRTHTTDLARTPLDMKLPLQWSLLAPHRSALGRKGQWLVWSPGSSGRDPEQQRGEVFIVIRNTPKPTECWKESQRERSTKTQVNTEKQGRTQPQRRKRAEAQEFRAQRGGNHSNKRNGGQ